MPQYVLLYHETPPDYDRPSHWDLMFERDGVLRTWALGSEPRPGESIDALLLNDHRIDFLRFEGALSRGRGTVKRVDGGSYEVLSATATQWVVCLQGGRWQTTLELNRLDDDQSWRLTLGGEST